MVEIIILATLALIVIILQGAYIYHQDTFHRRERERLIARLFITNNEDYVDLLENLGLREFSPSEKKPDPEGKKNTPEKEQRYVPLDDVSPDKLINAEDRS